MAVSQTWPNINNTYWGTTQNIPTMSTPPDIKHQPMPPVKTADNLDVMRPYVSPTNKHLGHPELERHGARLMISQ